MKIIDVNLDDVKYVWQRGGIPKTKIGKEYLGDWDLDVIPYQKFDRYIFCYNRFIKQKSWEESGAIDRARKEFIRKNIADGYKNMADVVHRYNNLDKLYKQFKDNPSSIIYFSNNIDSLYFHIGRDNNLIFSYWGGCHRFSIFKLLGIKNIQGALGLIHPLTNLSKFKITNVTLKIK